MKFRIFNNNNGDYFDIYGDTLEDIRTSAYKEVDRRGWDDVHSQRLEGDD